MPFAGKSVPGRQYPTYPLLGTARRGSGRVPGRDARHLAPRRGRHVSQSGNPWPGPPTLRRRDVLRNPDENLKFDSAVGAALWLAWRRCAPDFPDAPSTAPTLGGDVGSVCGGRPAAPR